ncbi:ABC transporter permease [Alloalcanivorax gelatiniphagus]|uniref:ABC transporter permease n=1 Tax=Alloalcanivorax gelatiniphagus TaxID=1194167 RepID=A0ABY2XIJ1_9GAMM|nr:ABC transporter permease [Alloalcanivorax gelatiniphagus]TMW11654.1 ABC transporter permease [Alloalcanivorax gelatiniphagus]
MSLSSLLIQMISGLSEASTLFLISVGLSLIFGVTRIVNFAHGSFYMLGIYLSYTLVSRFGDTASGFWLATLLSALTVAVIGALIEMTVLRRIYHVPELFQLLATFALVLVISDATLYLWGPEELLGPRAPGLSGSISLLGHRIPQYDLVLMAIGPLILVGLYLMLNLTRWGTLIRAATQDREMVGALGINQHWLFTGVFALGCFLAGLGGALQGPRVPANLLLDIEAIGTAFVIVVIGGMGSITGAFVASLLIAQIKALCYGIGTLTFFDVVIPLNQMTLVIEFLVMAIVLVVRPWGLLGRALPPSRQAPQSEPMLTPASKGVRWFGALIALVLMMVPTFSESFPYLITLSVDMLIAVLFAASLHFIMGPGGLHSFGHAAYFGLGAYGAGLLVLMLGLPMELAMILGPLVAALGALVFGWFSVRLSGVYLAMLTLAFAQIVWSVIYQWNGFTGGSNGLIGIWPSDWLASPTAFYYLTLASVIISVLLLRFGLFAPFGFALRAGRDSALRAEAIGINVKRIQWYAFTIAGLFGGVAGTLFAFSKGSISPEVISVSRSVDGLVMVLLGGINTLSGPIAGASIFTLLHDTVMRETTYWRAVLGLAVLTLVILFPTGIVGSAQAIGERIKSHLLNRQRGGQLNGAGNAQQSGGDPR